MSLKSQLECELADYFKSSAQMPCKYPCVLCSKSCKSYQKCILCDLCDKWVHLSCTDLTILEFTTLANSTASYYCSSCYSQIFPFHLLNNEELERSTGFYSKNSQNKKKTLIKANDNTPKYINSNLNSSIKTQETQYCEVKNIPSKVKQNFTILHVNIKSIKSNIDGLEELLCYFQNSPDIIAISETKLKVTDNCKTVLERYNFIHEGTDTNAGGVGIFIKDSITYTVCNNLKMDIPGCEDLWIKVNHKKFNCIVGAVYRHPHQMIKKFQEKFEITLDYLNNNKDIYYVAGDLNINLLNDNNQIKNYTDMVYSHGCIPLITHPTRITEKSSTIIDHIYTNNITRKIDSFIILRDLTDHLPVMVCTDFQRYPKNLNEMPTLIRDTRKFRTESFAKNLLDNFSNLGNISNPCNANQCMVDFIGAFRNTLNKHAPLRKQTRKEKKLRSKPWITKALLISIKHKNKLYAQCIKEQNETLWQEFKKYRNKLSHVKEQSKKLYFHKLILENKQNTAQLWKTINDILHHKNKKSNQIPVEM